MVVTDKVPELPVPTIAVILVEDPTVKELAEVPPKLTLVVPVKLVPVIVTTVPLFPLVGVKELMIGGLPKVNPSLLPVPFTVATATFPVVPVPTTAVIPLAESTTKDFAAVPPKLTEVVPVKLDPLMVTIVPLVPPIGVKDVTMGPV